jgi:farnesol dehydrogenase
MISLVTGGTGYLGSQLATALLDQGDEVRVLHRHGSDVSRLSGEVVLKEGDITDPASFARAADGCERIFHAAALVKTWVRDRSAFRRINVDGTANVCRTAEELGCRLIYTSSFFALGPTSSHPAREDHKRTSDTFCTEYERTKAAGHSVVLRAVEEGLDAVILYPCLVYGPGPMTQGNYVSRLAFDLMRRRLPGIPGDGSQRWTFSYVQDVVEGHLAAAVRARPGACYILGGPIASLEETLHLLSGLLDVKTPKLKVPIPVLKAYGWLGEVWAEISGHAPQVTRGVAETYRHHWAYDCSLAQKELDYPIRPLAEGLAEVVRYIRGFA